MPAYSQPGAPTSLSAPTWEQFRDRMRTPFARANGFTGQFGTGEWVNYQQANPLVGNMWSRYNTQLQDIWNRNYNPNYQAPTVPPLQTSLYGGNGNMPDVNNHPLITPDNTQTGQPYNPFGNTALQPRQPNARYNLTGAIRTPRRPTSFYNSMNAPQYGNDFNFSSDSGPLPALLGRTL